MSFGDFFVFEIANNHQGDVEHGKRIIGYMGEIARRHRVRAAIKFQLRQLDTFIHPSARTAIGNKHIQRFLDTQLSEKEFAELVRATRDAGLVPMATVFDEDSVDPFFALGMEILKIASCSARDYPLLSVLGKLNVPTILSTAGLNLEEVAKSVAVLNRDPADLAILHCVALYPTAPNDLLLDRIRQLREKFPGHEIGFSTHESPSSRLPIQLAYAQGARIFEKHVGLATEKYSLNSYSADPAQVESWMEAYKEAVSHCFAGGDKSLEVHGRERAQLRDLERAVFVNRPFGAGEEIPSSALQFAFPAGAGQMLVSDLDGARVTSLVADHAYSPGEGLPSSLPRSLRPQTDC